MKMKFYVKGGSLEPRVHLNPRTPSVAPEYGVKMTLYSRTSIARTSLGPWKFVRDMGSSSHWELIIAQGQKAIEKINLGLSFPSSIK